MKLTLSKRFDRLSCSDMILVSREDEFLDSGRFHFIIQVKNDSVNGKTLVTLVENRFKELFFSKKHGNIFMRNRITNGDHVSSGIINKKDLEVFLMYPVNLFQEYYANV